VPRTVEVRVEQTGPTSGEGAARTHRVPIDRPIEKGGSDRGPFGGELMLLGLGGCFLSTLLAAVAARSAEVSDVKVAVAGTIGGVPERFEAIDMRVTATYPDGELMKKVVAIAERSCIVTNTLRHALVITVSLE
jgi:putative redox protein